MPCLPPRQAPTLKWVRAWIWAGSSFVYTYCRRGPGLQSSPTEQWKTPRSVVWKPARSGFEPGPHSSWVRLDKMSNSLNLSFPTRTSNICSVLVLSGYSHTRHLLGVLVLGEGHSCGHKSRGRDGQCLGFTRRCLTVEDIRQQGLVGSAVAFGRGPWMPLT